MPDHDDKPVLQADFPASYPVNDSCADRLARELAKLLNTPTRPSDDRLQRAWRRLLQDTLLAWQCDPNLLGDEDEGIAPPSHEVIGRANEVVNALADRGIPVPDRIVSDGDGGIVVKWRTDGLLAALEFTPEGKAELVVYKNGRVDSTEQIPLPVAE